MFNSRLARDDYERILYNIKVVAQHHFDQGDFKTGFKTIAIALQDTWISSAEYTWKMRRARLNKKVEMLNFAMNVEKDIASL